MTTFDPDIFLNETVDGALSTVPEPIPDGFYLAVVGSSDKAVKLRQTTRGDTILDIIWEIQDGELSKLLGRENIIVKQSVFLDLTPQGSLDRSKGKNIQLGRVRAALNQNDPSKPWSLGALKGAGPAKIRVTQRPDNVDPSIIYNEVKGITAA